MKPKVKFKKFYSEFLYSQHLDYSINILLYLYTSNHSSVWLIHLNFYAFYIDFQIFNH